MVNSGISRLRTAASIPNGQPHRDNIVNAGFGGLGGLDPTGLNAADFALNWAFGRERGWTI
jgi:hypothetical protein